MTGPGLDPRPDEREALREALHALVDLAVDGVESLRRERPWRPLERRTQAFFTGPLPETPLAPRALVEALERAGLTRPPGHAHPRFFGWVMGAGNLYGALGASAAALSGANAFGGAQPSTCLERQVLEWTAEALELPAHRGGVLVGGTSEASLVGLAAAVHHRLGPLDRPLHDRPRGRVLAGAAAHHSIARATRVLGLGDPVEVDVDAGDRLDPEALEAALLELGARGVRPVAVVASSGTPAAGAHDPLAPIAALARAHGAWLHVDGAFGAFSRAVPELAARAAGLEAADSVAVDHHKALHAPYASAALLVRDEGALEAALRVSSDYFHPFPGGLAGLRDWPGERSLATSRASSALGAWTTLRGLGMARLRAEIAASHARAQHLAARLDRSGAWRVHPWPEGPVVLAHPLPRDDRAVTRLATRLQQDGEAVVTPCRRPEGLALRISTLGHRQTEADLDALANLLIPPP